MNDDRSTQQRRLSIAALVAMVTAVAPAMIEWSFPDSIPSSILVVIAAIGGGVAGRIVSAPGERMRAHLGLMVGGVLAGAGGSLAVTWWLARRSSVSSPEVALALVLGAAPGVVLGGRLYLWLRRPRERVPRATVR